MIRYSVRFAAFAAGIAVVLLLAALASVPTPHWSSTLAVLVAYLVGRAFERIADDIVIEWEER